MIWHSVGSIQSRLVLLLQVFETISSSFSFCACFARKLCFLLEIQVSFIDEYSEFIMFYFLPELVLRNSLGEICREKESSFDRFDTACVSLSVAVDDWCHA